MASGRLPVSSRNWQSLSTISPSFHSSFRYQTISKKMSLLRKFDEDAVSEIDDEDEDEGGTHESDDSAKYPTLFMQLTSMYVSARILHLRPKFQCPPALCHFQISVPPPKSLDILVPMLRSRWPECSSPSPSQFLSSQKSSSKYLSRVSLVSLSFSKSSSRHL